MVKKGLIGILAGLISGLFSTGGGMILVPAFIYLLELDNTKAKRIIKDKHVLQCSIWYSTKEDRTKRVTIFYAWK